MRAVERAECGAISRDIMTRRTVICYYNSLRMNLVTFSSKAHNRQVSSRVRTRHRGGPCLELEMKFDVVGWKRLILLSYLRIHEDTILIGQWQCPNCPMVSRREIGSPTKRSKGRASQHRKRWCEVGVVGVLTALEAAPVGGPDPWWPAMQIVRNMQTHSSHTVQISVTLSTNMPLLFQIMNNLSYNGQEETEGIRSRKVISHCSKQRAPVTTLWHNCFQDWVSW